MYEFAGNPLYNWSQLTELDTRVSPLSTSLRMNRLRSRTMATWNPESNAWRR